MSDQILNKSLIAQQMWPNVTVEDAQTIAQIPLQKDISDKILKKQVRNARKRLVKQVSFVGVSNQKHTRSRTVKREVSRLTKRQVMLENKRKQYFDSLGVLQPGDGIFDEGLSIISKCQKNQNKLNKLLSLKVK